VTSLYSASTRALNCWDVFGPICEVADTGTHPIQGRLIYHTR
jgi:hypothetical protein